MNFEKNFYCVSSRVENNGQLYGCFKIGPFFEHQSLTFANTLRRTLLADQSRCTFNAVQIYGVTHEFSNLVGIRESIVDLLLNLEKIVFQTTQPLTKPQIAFLHSHGPRILRAQNIYLPPGWRCVRPDQYLATLEVDGQLLLKLFFSPNFSLFGRAKARSPIGGTLVPPSTTSKRGTKHRLRFQSKRKTKQIHPVKIMPCLTKFSNNLFITLNHSRLKNWKILEDFFQHQLGRKLGHSFLFVKVPSKKKTLSLKKDIFQKQENFLFLKSSLCAIEKAHYTLQTENFPMVDPHRSFQTTYIFFEVWTDGSLHPQTAIFKALKEILLEIFSYSLQITKSEKIQLLKTKEITKLSNWEFEEKFLNMEIGNFSLDLDTYIFLKKKKIYKIVDFCHFFQNENWENYPSLIKKTLYKFHFFIHSILYEK
uniref:Plastid-encoded RNA polymerase subunit alpha n=1 Tax=Johnson-sea-linkia profunda TaxID=575876 RepID=A0A386AXL6_9CHLO|nr:RNA polymerase a-subunit [Johnson-sea-linkia profunda]